MPNPLQVSAGVDEWHRYTSMHADYLFAAQDQFHRDVDLNGNGTIEREGGGYSEEALMDLCIWEAPDALEFSNSRCRTSGLLSWHTQTISNYYD